VPQGEEDEMSPSEADKLIEILDLTEARRSKWILAVDEDIHGFKPYLERLKFRVLSFEKGIKDRDLHPLLLKAGVDFFVTKNGQDFLEYLAEPTLPGNQYHILWVGEKLMADPERAAKGVEGAILYDSRFKGIAPSFFKITGAYITELPKIEKASERNRKK
jgi:hypothetical protein